MFKHKAPPAAYDLTELQRDANRKYSYSAKHTLSLMQSLYETHKLLTYPRTDSRYITKDVVPTLTERLKAIAVGPYREAAKALIRGRSIETKYIVNDAKVTDHHAIIPTEQYVDLNRLTRDERNIYDLVVRRFLAVLSPACEYDEVQVKATFGRHNFYAKGQIMRSPGWKNAYNQADADDEDEENEGTLPVINQGAPAFAKDCSDEADKTAGEIHGGNASYSYGKRFGSG